MRWPTLIVLLLAPTACPAAIIYGDPGVPIYGEINGVANLIVTVELTGEAPPPAPAPGYYTSSYYYYFTDAAGAFNPEYPQIGIAHADLANSPYGFWATLEGVTVPFSDSFRYLHTGVHFIKGGGHPVTGIGATFTLSLSDGLSFTPQPQDQSLRIAAAVPEAPAWVMALCGFAALSLLRAARGFKQ